MRIKRKYNRIIKHMRNILKVATRLDGIAHYCKRKRGRHFLAVIRSDISTILAKLISN